MNDSCDIRSLLDTLRAIAQEGINYTKNEYDLARYQRLLDTASKEYSAILQLPQETVDKMLQNELGSITPKLGVDIAVINSAGKLLVLRRSDDNRWCLPCGWMEVEEIPFQTAVREAREETGLTINPIGYIAISQKGPHNYPGFVNQVNICVAIEPVSKDAAITLSAEHTEFKWVTEYDLIDWHPGHERFQKLIFEAYKNRSLIVDVS